MQLIVIEHVVGSAMTLTIKTDFSHSPHFTEEETEAQWGGPVSALEKRSSAMVKN